MLWLSAWGKDSLSDGLHAECGTQEETAGGQLWFSDWGAGQPQSSRCSWVLPDITDIMILLNKKYHKHKT